MVLLAVMLFIPMLIWYFVQLDNTVAVWNLSAVPWYCDRSCYNTINKMEISTEGCLQRNKSTEHIFEMYGISADTPICYKRPDSRQSVCLKLVGGRYFVGTCNVNVVDHRIRCRKASDRMSWYRGPQSVSFSGKSCLRWDEVNSTFEPGDFSAHAGPSIKYPSSRYSTGIHSVENYCRNPDNWHMGPWCFIVGEFQMVRREACFKQCEQYKAPEFCLAKMLFPYMLPSSSPFRDAPTVTTDRKSIRDLSDIIDVLHVVRINSRVRPMFIPIYFNDYIHNYPADISTRLRCYQTGPQTRIAGPWTYSDADDPFPEKRYWLLELFKDIGADRMDRERVFRGDGGPRYTLWRPCFLACEDNNVPCWPVPQIGPNRRRFPYYGPQSYSIYRERCIAPFFAYQILVHNQKTKKNQKTNNTIYLKIFRNEVLYDRNKKPRLRNIFALSKGRLMESNRCFTLGDFLRGMDKSARSDMAQQYPLYKHILTIGAGCFVEIEYRKKIEYQACFADCPCNRSLHEPATFAENRCILEEKCNASKIIDEEDDVEEEEVNVLQNITGIGDVEPSNGLMVATIILLSIGLFSFVAVIIMATISLVYKPSAKGRQQAVIPSQ